jgi:hypothetical protein
LPPFLPTCGSGTITTGRQYAARPVDSATFVATSMMSDRHVCTSFGERDATASTASFIVPSSAV